MTHTIPPLPYALDALEPHISRETLEFHHGKHHQAYVTKLNELIEGTEFADMTLEDIIHKAPKGPIFNNAAQIWNHTFYFASLSGEKNTSPSDELASAIQKKWGDMETFQTEFSKQAIANFGSGWTWLVKKTDGLLDIVNTSNAETPLNTESVPLLTCDVWEHAYYIDYRNLRPKYLEHFWQVVDWNVISDRCV